MAYDLFLSIPSIPGESTVAGFANQIEVFSYSFGASNTVSFTSGGGSGEGKAQISDISFLKMVDLSSPLLLKALFLGKNIAPASGPGVILSAVPSNSTSQGASAAFLTYTLKDVFVTSVQDSGSTGGDSRPTESVSLAFGRFEETYRPQEPDGSLGRPVTVTYNRETNQTS